MSNSTNAAPKQGARKNVVAILAVILVVCLVGGIAGGAYLINQFGKVSDPSSANRVEPALPTQDKAMSNPVDFDALKQKNSDIIGWVYVPDADVNYPICQSPTDNSFYLSHDAEGNDQRFGAIFAELCNVSDFSDAVTVIYGHNGRDQLSMFGGLHKYEKRDFFDAHQNFYVYAPGHIYTYQVVSAFITDDNHLMNKYGFFQTYDQLRKFEKNIQNPKSVQSIVNKDVKLDDDSKFMVMSTCNAAELGQGNRFLVVGVLVNDTEAN